MSQENKTDTPLVPDSPGLWWVADATPGQPDLIVEIFQSRKGLRYYEHGQPESEAIDNRVKWIGPVASCAESKRTREALERIMEWSKVLYGSDARELEEMCRNALSAKGEV